MTALSVACESEIVSKNHNIQIVNVQQNVADGQLPYLELQSYSVATGNQEVNRENLHKLKYYKYYSMKIFKVTIDKRGFELSSLNAVIGGNVKFALTGSSFCYLKENFPDLFEKVSRLTS